MTFDIEDHACSTGDCPHDKQTECDKELDLFIRNDMPEPKNCPFCGSEPKRNHERFYIGTNYECTNQHCILNRPNEANGERWSYRVDPEKDELKKELKKLQSIITEIHQSCLCTRQTHGFDYHQVHETRGKPHPGHRWLTPVDLIENRVGFRWEYEKPEGVCKSWKVLTFKEFK